MVVDPAEKRRVGGITHGSCGVPGPRQCAEGGGLMPVYEYRCNGCGKKFSVPMSIGEYEKAKVKCPKCGKTRVTQLYGTFFAKTSKKS